jgi:hypothetical protein
MKRFIILFALLPFLGQAQTIEGTAFPAIGSIYTLTLADTTGIEPGNTGQGLTWDFSSLFNTGFIQVDSFLMPSATPYGAIFPTAGIADHETYPGTDYFVYYHDDGSEFQRVGNVQPDTVIYSDPANEFPYPISYGNTFSDTYFASYHQSLGGTLVHMHGVASETADATGTIILPTGTYPNVLRVTALRTEHDTIFGFSNTFVYAQYHYYRWYQANLYYPVMQIMVTDITFSPTGHSHSKTVGYRAGTPSGIIANTDPAQMLVVSPNPSLTGIFQFRLNDKSVQISEVEITDVTGQIIYKVNGNISTVNLSDQKAGIYFYHLQALDGKSCTGKLVKE